MSPEAGQSALKQTSSPGIEPIRGTGLLKGMFAAYLLGPTKQNHMVYQPSPPSPGACILISSFRET
jgi:hypothetical protein